MNIDAKEALRYLGYKGHAPDKRALKEVEWAMKTMVNTAEPRCVYKMMDCRINEDTVTLGSLTIQSAGLAKNLKGCRQAILFAATLGPQPDMLLKRYAHLDMSRAVILQAVAAAMVESYCNDCQRELTETWAKEIGLRPRFSPGYGDFSLNVQPKILSLLDAHRKIGLTATDSFMLAPTKSVTAVIGVGISKNDGLQYGCGQCAKTDCEYKRSEQAWVYGNC